MQLATDEESEVGGWKRNENKDREDKKKRREAEEGRRRKVISMKVSIREKLSVCRKISYLNLYLDFKMSDWKKLFKNYHRYFNKKTKTFTFPVEISMVFSTGKNTDEKALFNWLFFLFYSTFQDELWARVTLEIEFSHLSDFWTVALLSSSSFPHVFFRFNPSLVLNKFPGFFCNRT